MSLFKPLYHINLATHNSACFVFLVCFEGSCSSLPSLTPLTALRCSLCDVRRSTDMSQRPLSPVYCRCLPRFPGTCENICFCIRLKIVIFAGGCKHRANRAPSPELHLLLCSINRIRFDSSVRSKVLVEKFLGESGSFQ